MVLIVGKLFGQCSCIMSYHSLYKPPDASVKAIALCLIGVAIAISLGLYLV